MKKKMLAAMLLMSAALMLPVTANAEINAAEQRIIAVCNGTYSYNGKNYQVTDDYKAQVRAYLDREDINFTNAEVSEYIAKFYNNLPAGIDGGYLEEVKKPENNNSNDNNNDNNDNNQNAEPNTTPSASPSPDASVSGDVIVIDPNMNYTVSDNGAVAAEEKKESTDPATIEELAAEYNVSVDKIKQMQQQVADEQARIKPSAEPFEELEPTMTPSPSPSPSVSPSPSEEPTPEITKTPEAAATEEPVQVKESSNHAGAIAGIIACAAVIGAAIFLVIRKRKG